MFMHEDHNAKLCAACEFEIQENLPLASTSGHSLSQYCNLSHVR